MSDRDPDALPEREAQVRRLLADVRHTASIPDAVATRLDQVLEQLVAEGPSGREEVAPVVDLAARRRRRVGALLIAAAAVVVAGVGVGAVVRDDGVDEAASGDAVAQNAEAADEVAGDLGDLASAASPPAPGEPSMGASQDGAGSTQVGPEVSPAQAPAAPRRLTAAGFADEVARLQRRPGYRADDGVPVPGSDLSMAESFDCPPTDWGAGKLFAALYDGVPAVLAFRPPSGATQTVELLRCRTGDALRTTVLPVP